MPYSLGYTLFYVLTLLPATVVGTAFTIRYLRIRRWKLFSALSVPLYLIKAVLVFSGLTYQVNILMTTIFFVQLVILQLLFGTCRVYLRALFLLVHIFVDGISEFLLSWSFALTYGDMNLFFSGQPQYLMPITIGRLICLVLYTAGLTLVYNRLWRRLDRESAQRAISPMLLFLCSQWLCISNLFVFTRFSGSAAFVVYAAVIAVAIAGDVLLFRTMSRLEASYQMEQTLALADAQMRARQQQYQTLQEGITRTRRLRHDFNNHAQTLGYLLEQGRTADFLAQLDSLEDRLFENTAP